MQNPPHGIVSEVSDSDISKIILSHLLTMSSRPVNIPTMPNTNTNAESRREQE